MSLPWLESVPVWGETAKGKPVEAPRRFAAVFWGNGVNVKHWGARETPEGMVFNKSLRPLEPLKEHIHVFQDLWNPTSQIGPGGHFSKMNVLSGLKVKQTTTDVEVGTTMDQLMAQKLGHETPLPSLVLGTEGPSYGTDTGYTAMYSAHISWTSPTTPAPKEIYPQLAFDRLFQDGSARKQDRSILDLVLADAKSLQTKLSQHDTRKLGEYLTSVRELEQRIDRAQQISTKEGGWQPAVQVPTLQRPDRNIPTSPKEHLTLMLDLMVLALQMDKTRVATFMMTNDLSQMNFGYLGDIQGGQHENSHHANNPQKLDMYQRTNEHLVSLWADALTKMHNTKEGERSLLENSMVLLCSSLMDGNSHDSTKLPVVLAGRGGGTIRPGKFHDFSKAPNRKLCRLHLAILERMGVKMEKFGDAESPMSEIG